MNKKLYLTLAIIMLLTAACASNSSTPAAGTTVSEVLPMQTRLILGTLKLEETANAVTAEQAAELLPMWFVLQELNSSGSAAQEEIDGLVDQIQAALTQEQIQTISEMDLGAQDLMTVIQSSGGAAGSSANSAQTGSPVNAAPGNGAGGPPDDMPPGGDPGMLVIGGTVNSSGTTTVSQPGTGKVPAALFEAVIKLLEARVN